MLFFGVLGFLAVHNLGPLGFFGFPLASALYAWQRTIRNPRLERLIHQTGTWIDLQLATTKNNS